MTQIYILDREGKQIDEYDSQARPFLPREGEMISLKYDEKHQAVYEVIHVIHWIDKNIVLIGTGDFKISPTPLI